MKRNGALATARLALAMAVIGLVLDGVTPEASAQCNNTGRVAQVKAGGTGQVFTSCPSVTFSVAGQSMSTPSQCEMGHAFYHGTVYSCQGVAECTNCTNEGYKVTIDVYSGGGCPDVSELFEFIGGSWEDWSGVPEALKSAISCTKPKNDPTFDWSASVNDCPDCGDGQESAHVSGEAYEGGDGSLYIYWDDPLGAYPFTPSEPRNLFLSVPELAEVTDPSLVGGYFQQATESNGSLIGASIGASVTARHFDASGELESEVVHNLQGEVVDDGRFDLMVSWVVDKEDGAGPESFARRETFDGRILTSADSQAEVGNVFDQTAENMAGLLEPVRPAFEWVYDPFAFPMHPGIELSLEVGDQGELIYQRVHDGPEGAFVGSEYEFVEVGEAVRPIRKTVFLPDGSRLEERLFQDYREVKGSSNCERPSVIRQVYYTGGADSQPRSEVLLKVRSSRELTSDECQSVPAPYSRRQPWLIWQ